MKRLAWRCILFFPVVALAACATAAPHPLIKTAQILPTDLRPGDTAVISVEIEDRLEIVQRVEGVVKEDQTLTFVFRDDGVHPDEEALDGIWTIRVDVPFNAPPGEFEFEVTGYNAEGDVIVVHDKNKEAQPLSSSFHLVIDYPDGGAGQN